MQVYFAATINILQLLLQQDTRLLRVFDTIVVQPQEYVTITYNLVGIDTILKPSCISKVT